MKAVSFLRERKIIVYKTEGFPLSPNDITDSIIGVPHVAISTENNQANIEHGATAFRTEEEAFFLSCTIR
jgi:hypothetical protein